MISWSRFAVISAITRNLRAMQRSRFYSSSETKEIRLVQTSVQNKRSIEEIAGITDKDLENDEEQNVLAPKLGKNVDFSDYGPPLGRTQTFAAYVNRSPTLQKLVDLGVDLSVVEKKEGVPEKLLQLDFDKHITKHILFLTDVGVPAGDIGLLLTRNPAILFEDLEILQQRIKYLLETLGFEFTDLQRIICANPKWLCTSIDDLRKRVDFFQREFKLSLPLFRKLTLTYPRLITYKLHYIRANTFSIIVEMGFTRSELGSMLMFKPRIWTLDNKDLVERFNFLHNSLKIPHRLIAQQPHCLLARVSHLRQRHFFLHSLGKAQYDPALPNYVSLLALVTGSGAEFASNVAGTSAESFSNFLKTM
ncbi:transcription termination factor 3, mitochondrial [Cloeon dipterum]|uniref:transcription termination factor 3, mitochondrial n=1 Tax=Cloeon dipterum TaxID=197152 RepID=UPI003220153B